MSDIRTESDEGSNAGFKEEFRRIAREKATGQEETPPDDGLDERHDAAASDEAGAGQGDKPPQGSDAARPSGGEASDEGDIWADADPKLKAAYEAAVAERERTANQVRTQDGRLSQAVRRSLELEARLTALEAQKPGGDKGEEEQGLTAEERSALEEEFPDVAKPLLGVIGALERQVESLKASDASRQEQADAADQLELQRFLATEEQSLAAAHPDWRTFAGTDQFKAWVDTKPQMIQDVYQRNANAIVNSGDAIMVMDLYKSETGGGDQKKELTAKRQRQLDGARLPTSQTPPAAVDETSGDFKAEFRKRVRELKRLRLSQEKPQ